MWKCLGVRLQCTYNVKRWFRNNNNNNNNNDKIVIIAIVVIDASWGMRAHRIIWLSQTGKSAIAWLNQGTLESPFPQSIGIEITDALK